jgi:2,4-dienoyl-CoA reductase-like NADH-dependent reductase (Old Yellow Enzyme family)
VRRHWRGNLIVNNELDRTKAETLIADGVDAVSFGRAFIANPDLVEKLRHGSSVADFDPSKLYTAGAEGYTDYPALTG